MAGLTLQTDRKTQNMPEEMNLYSRQGMILLGNNLINTIKYKRM